MLFFHKGEFALSKCPEGSPHLKYLIHCLELYFCERDKEGIEEDSEHLFHRPPHNDKPG